jgi:hypothetical protein
MTDLSKLVTPLVWVENQDNGEQGWLGGADAGLGPVYHATDDAWSYYRGMFWRDASSIEAAKAAAQADYTARIIAALDPEALAKIRADALREAADFCFWNAVGLQPRQGYVLTEWTQEGGGKHPGMAYYTAILAMIDKEDQA